jgi:hypothetical protein
LLSALSSQLSADLYADDEPFTYPSNQGFTGIMEIPTARVMKENHYRMGASQVHPYRYYYVAFSPLKRIEIDGRVTEIIGVKAGQGDPYWSGYGNDKDKFFGFKYQFIKEDKVAPAIALSIMDPTGTRKYASQSIIASKQLYPFDFTVGFGNGRYGKAQLPPADEGFKFELFNNPRSWAKDSQFFWGIQWAISDHYALMVEYSPIQYNKQTSDPAQAKYFQEPVPSQYNYGLRWKPFKFAEVDISYQRGQELGINLSMNFDIGQPIIPIYDPAYREKQEDKTAPINKRLTTALHRSGFSSIGILIDRNDLWIRAQNNKYYYSTKAIGVITRIINEIVPHHIQNIHITLTDNEIPIFELDTTRSDIAELYNDKLTAGQFIYLSRIDTAIGRPPDMTVENKKSFDYAIKPSLQTFLNDPSGFFKYRLGAEALVSFRPWKGGSFVVGPGVYPLNNISTVNEPLADHVRTDIVDYQEKRFSLPRLLFDQVYKTGNEIYGRFSTGYLEIEYGGFDGEIAKPLKNGRFVVGLSGTLVKKRDPDSVFAFKDDDRRFYYTSFVNARLNVPEYELSFDAKTGRFLGGDLGSRFSVSKFINGVILTAWYSVTDTSGFRDSYNRGYHDKGIALVIPFRLFSGRDSKTTFNYAISPWTRDVAQDINHYNPLFDFIGRNTKIFLDRDKNMLYK